MRAISENIDQNQKYCSELVRATHLTEINISDFARYKQYGLLPEYFFTPKGDSNEEVLVTYNVISETAFSGKHSTSMQGLYYIIVMTFALIP